LTFNRNIATFIGYAWANGVLFGLKKICNLSYKIKGKENIPKAPFLVASKHQSTWETVFLTAYFKNAKYILKKELTRIPFYGWYLLLTRMIYIDRKLGVRAIKKIAQDTKRTLEEKNIVIIFPEGTRVKPNESKAYLPGIAAIHQANSHIPILPVALNSGCYWPKGLSLIRPGEVEIEFLEPITTELSKSELLSVLKEKIDSHSNMLTK
jgi:1-acyl-sn-glycerol-3-phosphate acyltransferase